MWILWNVSLMRTETHLKQYCDIHVTSIWWQNNWHRLLWIRVWSCTWILTLNYEQRQNLQSLYCLNLLTNKTHSTKSNSVFLHNCKESDSFQATPTPLMSPQSICITLRYQPISLNMVSQLPFPQNAGTDVLDDLHKVTIYLNILYNLRLKYQFWSVSAVHPMEGEIRTVKYITLEVRGI